MYVISNGICIDIERLKIFVYVVYGSGKAVKYERSSSCSEIFYLFEMDDNCCFHIYILYSTRRYK